MIPDSISGYKIERQLEKGGMSIVYLATHPETKELVSIKVLSPKYLSNTEVINRFLREAEIIALADHPNIVKLYNQGRWEEGLYIAMEYIQGISLKNFLQNNVISLKRALEISLRIAYALCHLHTHGVIHRDLKPENILLTKEGEVKVIDFGIAQVLQESTTEEESGRRIIGTPAYMSPEQQKNPNSVEYPSDIYSLGIIIYELVLNKLCHGKVHVSLMPKGLQPILAKCLQPNPQDRYQDVVALIADLSEYMNSERLTQDEEQKGRFYHLSEELERARKGLISSTKNATISFHLGKSTQGLFLKEVAPLTFFIGTGGSNEISGLSSSYEALGALNTLLKQGLIPEEIFSAIHPSNPSQLCFFSLSNHEIRYISTSLGSAWILHNGEITEIHSEFPPIGGEVKAQYKPTIVTVKEGAVFLYINIPKEELTSIGWKQLATELLELPPQKLVETLLSKLLSFYPNQEKDILVLSHNFSLE